MRYPVTLAASLKLNILIYAVTTTQKRPQPDTDPIESVACKKHHAAETSTVIGYLGGQLFGTPGKIIILICLLLNPCAEVLSKNEKLLHISTAFGPPISTSDKRGFFDLLMKQACARIGYRVRIDHPQAGRALMLTNSGYNDGDGPRVDTLDNFSTYPNLIRVEEPLMKIDFVAFTRDPTIQIHSWDDLYGYNVAIVRGWKILEKRLSYLSSLVKVKDVKHALLLLKYGRTDIIILDRYSGVETAHELGMHHIHINSPPIYSRSMYLYLNKKRGDVAKKLATAIRAMKKDGSYQKIYKETLSNVIAQQSDITR